MTRRKYSFLLLLAASIAAPLWAGTHSAAAFKKLQSLSGDWEGKDGHGMAVKTSFQVLASGTAVMETLSPSGMEDMVTLYSIDGGHRPRPLLPHEQPAAHARGARCR